MSACQYPSLNHSEDGDVTVFCGREQPVILCGFHSTWDLNKVLTAIDNAKKDIPTDGDIIRVAEDRIFDWNTRTDILVWRREGSAVHRVTVKVTMLPHGRSWDWPDAKVMRRRVDATLKPLFLKRSGSRELRPQAVGAISWIFTYSTETI